MKTQPTLRPWNISDEFSTDTEIAIECNSQGMILLEKLTKDCPMQANAALIVRAVNCHDELTNALADILSEVNELVIFDDSNELQLKVEKYNDLLKRAKGEL